MSISTKRGDGGETDLMYGRRVPKGDIRVAAYGAVDELNAALGLARASGSHPEVIEIIDAIQAHLVGAMGELATHADDKERYRTDGYAGLTQEALDLATSTVDRIESDFDIRFKGWVTPGKDATLCSAHLDLARTICRRAEREVIALVAEQTTENPLMVPYLNRLSDLLWLLARHENLLAKGGPED